MAPIPRTAAAAVQHHQAGRLAEAERIYRQILEVDSSNADALHLLGVVARQHGKPEMAVELIRRALQIEPEFAEAHSNLGNALQDQGMIDEAVASFQRAIQIEPDYAEAHNNLGTALQKQGKLDEATASYRRALQIKPDFAEAYSNLCGLYEKHNMITELKNTLHQAQEVLPKNDSQLLYRMAQLASREERLEDARDFLESISPETLPLSVRQRHSELLAKTYDKLDQFSSAFAQFEITNELTKQSFNANRFSAQRSFDKVSHLSESWSNVAERQWQVQRTLTKQHSLAFLVGFPRSGTTLLDTILRSHPEVSVVEEKPNVAAMRTHIGEIATFDLLTGLDDGQIAELRAVYFEELYSHVKSTGSHKLIIDKLPLNITDVGLIHRVFPDSKIILALRHPFDCVLSCFMQTFELNDAMSNFLTLHQSAKFYDAVMSLWVHYNNTCDLEVGTVKYEDLVHDLQGTAEPLLNFLGLDWRDNLLNFQQTALSRDRINTPSYNQVTQSLYTQASGRWKNYQDQIKGIVPLLEPWARRFGYSTEL